MYVALQHFKVLSLFHFILNVLIDLEVPSSKFHDSRGHEPSELEGAQASGPEALGKECEEMRSQKCRLQSKSGGSRRR